jgi:nicotinate phosphoribosyltransferase
MGTAAITKDYLHANARALSKWRDTYQDELGIALTDTFGTNIFLQNFNVDLAQKFAGVRQDSGSPEAFAGRMVQFYQDRVSRTSHDGQI